MAASGGIGIIHYTLSQR